jgi:hypothetical protein
MNELMHIPPFMANWNSADGCADCPDAKDSV